MIPQVAQRVAQDGMGRGEVGIQANRLLKLGDGAGLIPGPSEERAEVLVARRRERVQAERLREAAMAADRSPRRLRASAR